MDGSETILTTARQLAESLSTSDIYRNYRRSRIRLEGKPVLARKLLAFKKKQAAFETKRLHNQPVTFEEEKMISHL